MAKVFAGGEEITIEELIAKHSLSYIVSMMQSIDPGTFNDTLLSMPDEFTEYELITDFLAWTHKPLIVG